MYRVLSLVRTRFLSLACVTRTAAFLEQHSWGHRTIHLLHLQPIAEIKGTKQKVILFELYLTKHYSMTFYDFVHDLSKFSMSSLVCLARAKALKDCASSKAP